MLLVRTKRPARIIRVVVGIMGWVAIASLCSAQELKTETLFDPALNMKARPDRRPDYERKSTSNPTSPLDLWLRDEGCVATL